MYESFFVSIKKLTLVFKEFIVSYNYREKESPVATINYKDCLRFLFFIMFLELMLYIANNIYGHVIAVYVIICLFSICSVLFFYYVCVLVFKPVKTIYFDLRNKEFNMIYKNEYDVLYIERWRKKVSVYSIDVLRKFSSVLYNDLSNNCVSYFSLDGIGKGLTFVISFCTILYFILKNILNIDFVPSLNEHLRILNDVLKVIVLFSIFLGIFFVYCDLQGRNNHIRNVKLLFLVMLNEVIKDKEKVLKDDKFDQ